VGQWCDRRLHKELITDAKIDATYFLRITKKCGKGNNDTSHRLSKET